MDRNINFRYPGSRPFQDTSIDRLLFFGRDKEKIALLDKVLAQRLVRRICEHCKEKNGLASEVLGYIPGDEDFHLYEGRGCKICGNSGFSGRVGLYEFLVIDDTLSRGISQGADLVDLRKVAEEG